MAPPHLFLSAISEKRLSVCLLMYFGLTLPHQECEHYWQIIHCLRADSGRDLCFFTLEHPWEHLLKVQVRIYLKELEWKGTLHEKRNLRE